ncbi:hypothetical protein SLA2020_275120 [Shorea laevis]
MRKTVSTSSFRDGFPEQNGLERNGTEGTYPSCGRNARRLAVVIIVSVLTYNFDYLFCFVFSVLFFGFG